MIVFNQPSYSKTSLLFKNQDMKKHVNEEVTEFLKFLQNSAKKCAQDYNMLSDEAHLFTEVKKKKKNHVYLNCQVIGNCSILQCVMILPKAYGITSIIKLETKLYVGLLFFVCLNNRNTVLTPQNHVLYSMFIFVLFSINNSTTIYIWELYFYSHGWFDWMHWFPIRENECLSSYLGP